MLKVLESKSERVEHELRSDPNRSDREIGRICGVDHKTVAARRAKIPQSGEMGNLNSPPSNSEAENSPGDSPATTVLLPAQGEITISWNEDGDMILRQSDWPNEDAVIVIARDYLWMFIDRLTDAMGIPSTKGL
jgi:hypothetical protein